MAGRKGSNAGAESKRVREILRILAETYPHGECALRHESPFQLLIATILSAQCTDARVNEVTPALFHQFPNPAAFATAEVETIEEAIRPTGFFRNKARNIQGCCQRLLEIHGGEVPQTLEELVELPGVGRKTAHVILGNCFGVPGIVVDTHMERLAGRLGLSGSTGPVPIERDLARLISAEEQIDFCHRMIQHGRTCCHARKPSCPACGLERVCPKKNIK